MNLFKFLILYPPHKMSKQKKICLILSNDMKYCRQKFNFSLDQINKDINHFSNFVIVKTNFVTIKNHNYNPQHTINQIYRRCVTEFICMTDSSLKGTFYDPEEHFLDNDFHLSIKNIRLQSFDKILVENLFTMLKSNRKVFLTYNTVQNAIKTIVNNAVFQEDVLERLIFISIQKKTFNFPNCKFSGFLALEINVIKMYEPFPEFVKVFPALSAICQNNKNAQITILIDFSCKTMFMNTVVQLLTKYFAEISQINKLSPETTLINKICKISLNKFALSIWNKTNLNRYLEFRHKCTFNYIETYFDEFTTSEEIKEAFKYHYLTKKLVNVDYKILFSQYVDVRNIYRIFIKSFISFLT